MGKCIQKKYNGVIENQSIPMFGKIIIQLTNRGTAGVGNVPAWKSSYGTLKSDSSYFTNDIHGQSNLGNHKIENSAVNGYEWAYLSEDCDLIVEDKYSLTHFQCNGNVTGGVYMNMKSPLDLSEFKYMFNLQKIMIIGNYLDLNGVAKLCVTGNLDEFIDTQGQSKNNRVMSYNFEDRYSAGSDIIHTKYELSGWLITHSDGTYEVVYEDPNA